PPRPAGERPSLVDGVRRVVEGVSVRADGVVERQGSVDLGETLDRIARGERFPSRNDGAVFQNRERRLPAHPSGYYREYVHPTPGMRGPGPQRLIRGERGEWYYTPDHYGTFIPLNGARAP
ncbi:MAG: ribonuclease, partial [Deltaproteobacteria bacterium]|nr:ribonuclease [Deltaproteobacteria bacterium]